MNAPSPASSTVRVIPAEQRHVEEMVTCHVAAFPGEFLTLLGPSFLRAFYRFCGDRAEGISLVAVNEDGRVMGLVTGGAPELRSRFLRRHMLRFLVTALGKSFVHARVRQRTCEHMGAGLRAVLRKLRLLPAKAATAPPEDAPGTWSNLISICVHPDFRGRGAGKALMEAFRAESARRGYRTMRLSVHNDSHAAIALYKRAGWQPILTTPKGTYFTRSVEEAK